MYSRFLDIMRKAGIEMDVTELAESLWLARIARLASGAAGRGAASDATGEADSAGQQQPAEAASAPAKAAEARSRTTAAYASRDAGAEGIPAAELLLPAASPLSNPAAAAIGRALRPLARRRASRGDLLFDEEATADASGETGVVTPVFRPAPERWFSVAVVMEETASMAVWQELAEEMERLFAQHGGFNQATQWRLRFDGDNDWLVAPDGSLQPVSHLHRLGERQLILVMTDGASSRWDDGRMAGVLHRWGRVCPVVILQVVAERMWRNTRLGVPTVMVSYSLPLAPKPAPIAAAGKPVTNKGDESWRHLITEAEVPLFNTLREWRSARCKHDGVPPYVICNNRQLAAIVKSRPQSLAELGQVEGFGEAKLRSYGPDILALTAQSQPELPTSASPADEPGKQPETTGGEQ